VRVVPNLYPAFERQEVVVHTPRHARSLAELTDDECALVGEAWQRRARDTDARYLHALVNEGAAAGASLAHTHSQLVWLDEPPPEVARERRVEPLWEDGLFAERQGLAACTSYAGRAPYELVVAPTGPAGDPFSSPLLGPAIALVAESVRRLRAVEGAVAWNAWLHLASTAEGRWHLHVLPRLTVFAGLELGAGIYVNPLPPEEAAAALRAAG
jgi:UDPglucose--hexose-1-phosphate uridylyltransferase